MCQTAI